MSQPLRQLDTHLEMVTPENIAFHYRIAGPFQRLPAYLLDLLIQAVMIFGAFIVLVLVGALAALPGGGIGLALVFLFAVNWFYGGFFETVMNGQTPGKRLMRLRVVSVDGQPINALQAVLRNLLRAVDMLPAGFQVIMTYQFALLSAALSERFQRLGDLACGTMVVVEEPQYRSGVVRIVDPEVLALAGEIPANFVASHSLALALSGYVLRRASIPWSRRLQIARHVAEPLRERFLLPSDTNYDRLLCAVYQRIFFGDTEAPSPASPFAPTGGEPALEGVGRQSSLPVPSIAGRATPDADISVASGP